MANDINALRGGNLYVEGESKMGKVLEIGLPQVKSLLAEHAPLGQRGKMELPTGFDKLEATVKWQSFYSDVAKKMANPYKAMKLQYRSNMEVWNDGSRTEEKPFVCYLTARCNDFPLGSFKGNENPDFSSTFSVSYIKLEVDGHPIFEIDVENNIYKVDNEDMLATYRSNLGID